MAYRALRNLSNGIRRGQVFAESVLPPETAELLLRKQIIVPVLSPPLEVLPGWEPLQEAGVETLSDVIDRAVEQPELEPWADMAHEILDDIC